MARDVLRRARQEAGFTQQQVADGLGISLRYYCHLEAGTRTGDFEIWDALEDMFSIHQRELRRQSEMPSSQSAETPSARAIRATELSDGSRSPFSQRQ